MKSYSILGSILLFIKLFSKYFLGDNGEKEVF